MWGQGNEREDRFSTIFTKQLKDRVGKPGVLVWDASRSGARIREAPGERQEFADTYPHLFPTAQVRKAFLAGDDAPAARLYGEVPATFPTVLGQVEMIPKSLARQIDVALVDGGVNDINVEDVINPLLATGHYIERYDGEIRRVVEKDVVALLQAVREKCPKAVIMYFGFFPGFSYASGVLQARIRRRLQVAAQPLCLRDDRRQQDDQRGDHASLVVQRSLAVLDAARGERDGRQ
jgi:hypothetical protein